MSDLREQLANRLFDVVQVARHRQLDPGTLYSKAQFTEYKDLADECIRQMEWARGLVPRCEFDCKGCPKCESFGYQPLTLAPEDWKP